MTPGSQTIICVRQERDDRAHIEGLRQAGYRVVEVPNKEEALRLVEKGGPALLLLHEDDTERFQTLADGSPALVWMNGPDGCEFVNKAYLEFLGVRDMNVRGFDWAQFVHPDDYEAYVNAYRLAVVDRRFFEATFRFRRYDGEYRWMKSVGTPRLTDDGTFVGYVGSTLDITDIQQAQHHESLPTSQGDTENGWKEVDGELRTSQSQLTNVLQTMTDGIQIIRHDWRVTYMNDAAKRMLREQGRDPDALVGQRVFDRPFPDVKDSPYYQHLQRVMDERVPVEFEILYEPLKGWYHVRAYPVQENGIAVVFQDITQRRAEAHVHNLFEVAPDATVMIGPDGRIMRVNLQTERLFGYCRDELVGRPVEMLIPVRLRAAHAAHRGGYMTAASLRPMGVGRELLALRKDGAEVAVEISLSPIETNDGTQVIAAVRDVTDQRRAKQELARLAEIVQSSDDAIISKDRAGIITSWNRGAERLFGDAAEEAIGRSIKMLIPPDRDEEERHIMATVVDHEEVKHCETIRRRKDGTLVDVSLTVSPIRNERGALVGVSTIARDITARKQAETALCESEARMASEATALARLNELSSHLWRTASLGKGLNEMLTATIELLGADMGDVQLMDGRGVLTIAAQKGFGHDFLEFFREVSIEDNSACGRALRSGKRIVIEDVETDVPYAPMRDIARASGYRAVQSTPLMARDGRPLGMLSTHWRSPHRPSDLDLHRLELYIRQATDFIERCRIEEALRESEERLTLALAGGDLATWDWELESGHLTFNERWAHMREYEPSEVVPSVNSWMDGIHPDDLSVMKDRLDRYLRDHNPTYECEMRVRTRSGGWRWILDRGKISARDSVGRPIRMTGTELDITERKQAEEALREAQARLRRWNAELEEAVNVKTAEFQRSQQRLDLAQRAARIGTFDWNLHTGVNVWTPELETMYGLKAGEFAGSQRAWEDFVHPDDRESAIAGINHSLATGEQVEREFRIVRPDGTIRWLLGRWQMLRNHTGQPLHVTGINIDITERKKTEEELRSTQDRLRALAAELNLAEQRERKRLATELHDHLQQILVLGKLTIGQSKRIVVGIPVCEKVINKLDDLLSDALSYSRTLVAELSPPVLRDHGLAAGLKWLGDHMKKYDLVVTVTVPEEKVRLREDQVLLLFQSVRELLINSGKHAGTGQADVALEERNGHLQITVHDNGAGFDLAAAAAADSPTGGLSSKFGLFSIRERMLVLGGSFDLQSAPGKGTTARLVLPLDSRRETDIGNVESGM